MSRILVTGGCGFVGVNLGRLLATRGVEIVAFDDLSEGHRDDGTAAGYGEIIVGDVRDADAIGSAASGCDAVVHLAAQTGVPASLIDPLLSVDVNVRGTLNTLLAARDANVRTFVFASSNAPLGDSNAVVHENIVPRPKSPYGASKLAGEALCAAFSSSYELSTTALRFSNVYGPFSYHKGSVIAKYFKRIAADEPLVVNGDGEQTRDFVHVEDLCRGIAAALDRPGDGDVYHLGTGVETSINQLVTEMRALFPDRDLTVEHGPELAGEIRRSCSDISKARSELGYSARIGLREGLATTRAWFDHSSRT